MRILSFKADGRILPHTLQDVQDTLRRAGHEVDRLDLRRAAPPVRMVLLADTLAQRRPDLLFTVDHCGVLPAILNAFIHPPPVISWFYDNPLKILQPLDRLIKDRLYLFLWDAAYMEPVRALGFTHVYYQPFGAPSSFFREESYDGPFLHDVSFIGGHSPRRELLLRALAERNIEVHLFGNEAWRAVAHPNLHYEGYASYREDCPHLYRASKINLNITSEQLRTALPVRVFDVLACGGLLLTDDQQDAHTLFNPGKELVVYQNPDHLADLIRHYLTHDEERQAIAEAGMRRVQNDYSFDRLIPQMLVRAGISPAEPPAESIPDRTLNGWRAGWIASMSCLKHNDYAQARSLIKRLTASDPDHDLTCAAEALLYARTNNPEATEQILSRVPIHSDFWNVLAPALRRVLREQARPDWNFLYEHFLASTVKKNT